MAEHDSEYSDDNDLHVDNSASPPRHPLTAQESLAEVALNRALSLKARRLIARGSSVIIIKTPDADWIDILTRAVANLGDHVRVVAAPERMISKHADRPVGADELSSVQHGRSIVYLCHDPIGILDQAVLAAADATVTIDPVNQGTIRQVVRQVTGRVARGVTQQMADLPITRIVTAIRPRLTAGECLDNLRKVPPQPTTGKPAVPMLHDLPLTGSVRRWTNSTLADLASVSAGTLLPDALTCGILEGPPGTGKTLLAQSLAATSGWSFVSSSVGQWFTVGDGALGAASRNLTKFIDEAIASAPTVAFLDELDALPSRATMDARGRDFWTPLVTLFLTEIDRLRASGKAVLLLGATNFYDRLDAALVRPGRLQQRIFVGPPETRDELSDLFRFHLGPDAHRIDVASLMNLTLGATPAAVEGWVREARATARGQNRAMSLDDLIAQILPKDNRTPEDVRTIALHEAGHAFVAHRLGLKVQWVSIMQSGEVGGAVASALPTIAPTLGGVRDQVTVALAGRAADICFGRGANTGASVDLEQATRLLIDAHERQGLFGTLLYGPALTIRPSPATISAVASDLDALLARAMQMLERECDLVLALTDRLIKFRVLSGEEVATFLSRMPTCARTEAGTAAVPGAGASPPRHTSRTTTASPA